MNRRAKYWPEAVFVRGGGGGVRVRFDCCICEISFSFFVLQHVQAGAIQKYLYYIFVISLSAIIYMHVFLSTNYTCIHVYIN